MLPGPAHPPPQPRCHASCSSDLHRNLCPLVSHCLTLDFLTAEASPGTGQSTSWPQACPSPVHASARSLSHSRAPSCSVFSPPALSLFAPRRRPTGSDTTANWPPLSLRAEGWGSRSHPEETGWGRTQEPRQPAAGCGGPEGDQGCSGRDMPGGGVWPGPPVAWAAAYSEGAA